MEAAVVFLDSVVTQVSAAHLQPGRGAAPERAGILAELEALLQQVPARAAWPLGPLSDFLLHAGTPSALLASSGPCTGLLTRTVAA